MSWLPISLSSCNLTWVIQVTQLVYCKDTKTIISVDYYGTIAVTSEIQCNLKKV